MKFIILTRPEDGKRIYVNPNNICTFCENYCATDGTIVSFVGDENCYINVSESPEAIANLIEGVTEHPTVHHEPHWIPVTEKLPGIGEPVLDESLSVNWMSYASGGKEWIFPRDVKAWIPLPGEPYKEVTE